MNHLYLSIYLRDGDEMHLLEAVRFSDEPMWVHQYLDENYVRIVSLLGTVNWMKGNQYIYYCVSPYVCTVRDREDGILHCSEYEDD